MLGSARRGAEGHGRLMDPPARNSMWRFGFPNPVNYNDNELFCGGYAGNNYWLKQWPNGYDVGLQVERCGFEPHLLYHTETSPRSALAMFNLFFQ